LLTARALLRPEAMRPTLVLTLSLVLAATAAADLIVPQSAAPRILIPVAGDAPGANGTHFRTDMTIVNFRNVPQRVNLRWFRQGGSNDGIPQRTITIDAQSGFNSTDFVRNVMFQSGLGAIEVRGVDEANDFDPTARLHASARVYTPQPNVSGGTTSQTLPALIPTGTGRFAQAIFGVRRSEQYRLNAGIVNPNASTNRFRISVLTSTGARETRELDLAPFSMDQVNMPGTSDVVQILIENLSTPTAYWEAWASSIDNITGDGWAQMAFPPPAQ
jgi:hypothetical protein